MTPNDNNNGIKLNIDESLYAPKSKKKLIIGLVIFFIILLAAFLYVYGRSNGWGVDDGVIVGNMTVVDKDTNSEHVGRLEISIGKDTDKTTQKQEDYVTDDRVPDTDSFDPNEPADSEEHTDSGSSVPGLSYITVTMQENAYKKGELILINAEHKYDVLADTTLTKELKSILYSSNGSYQVVYQTDMLRSDTIKAMNKMFGAFQTQTGLTGYIITPDFAYCTAEDQQKWYDSTANKKGEAMAPYFEFRGGESEHETGRAFDLRVKTDTGRVLVENADPIYSWIFDHAHEYGFIYRYPNSKSATTGVHLDPVSTHQDHFRYVGVAAATAMYENDWCLEEFLAEVEKYSFDGERMKVTAEDGTMYEMYYVRAAKGETNVKIPENTPYSISGNNIDGFIVTLTVK